MRRAHLGHSNKVCSVSPLPEGVNDPCTGGKREA